MKFGKIDSYILLGGGELVVHFALMLRKREKECFVVTSARHAQETLVWNNENVSFPDCLQSLHIRYEIVENINEAAALNERISDGTLGLSFGAAWIFKEEFIKRFQGRFLNCHGSQLPKNRGGGGFSWRIMQNNTEGMCLVHMLDTGIDTGDIVKMKPFQFSDKCRIPQDYECAYIQEMKIFLRKNLT